MILLYVNVNWEARDTDAAGGSHLGAEAGLRVGQLERSWDLSGLGPFLLTESGGGITRDSGQPISQCLQTGKFHPDAL